MNVATALPVVPQPIRQHTLAVIRSGMLIMRPVPKQAIHLVVGPFQAVVYITEGMSSIHGFIQPNKHSPQNGRQMNIA